MNSPYIAPTGSHALPGVSNGARTSQYHPQCPLTGRASSHSRLDGKRVLIVDDNNDAADSLGMLLNLLGAQVRTVYEGPAAQTGFEAFRPHLVLLDIGMPVMDGYEVARRIRANLNVGESTRIVAVTGWAKEDVRHLSLMAGFDDLLIKPVAMKDLERVIWSLGLC